MNAFTRFLLKASRAWQSILWPYGPGQAVYTPRNYEDLAKEGFEQNAVVFACVSLIMDAAGSIPVVLQQRTSKGVERVDRHEVLDLIARPNPMQSEYDFRAAWAGFLLLSGNSYVHGPGPSGGDRAGRPMELWGLRPDRVRIKAGTWNEPVGGYLFEDGGAKQEFEPQEISHTKLFNPRHAFYGLSPIEAAARGIDQYNASNDWNVSVLQNMAAPPAWVNIKGTLPPDQKQGLKERFADGLGGAKNARKPIITTGNEGIDFHKLGFNALELDWLEGKKMSAHEICAAFRVPGQLVGIPDSQTYANFEMASKAFYYQAALPVLGRFCDAMSRWLLPAYGLGGDDFFLWYDVSDVQALQENRKEQAERAERLFRAGIITQKQAAREAGLEDDLQEDLFYYDLFRGPGLQPDQQKALEQARKAFGPRVQALLEAHTRTN